MGHVPFDLRLDHALASGQRSIEHVSGYDRALSGSRGFVGW